MHFLMIFVDGFGLGQLEYNPIMAAKTPYLDKLLGGHVLWGGRPLAGTSVLKHGQARLCPLDASLDVSGVPQSATGQTTLWTGVNAAKVLGHHLNAYPNAALREIITEHSIFKQLADKGKKVMFANAFTHEFEKLVAEGKKKVTASTLSALAGGVVLRRIPELMAGKAVYQDITHKLLREHGLDIPLISAYAAGQNLGKLSLEYDFTLYEFFQTDVKGHKLRWDESVELIEQLDEFIGGLMSVLDSEESEAAAWLLTSDHGNIEDFTVKGHTTNPVPALCWSKQPLDWPDWTKLEEITPGIIQLLQ
ncbi:MAG: metalloenzyme [Desulfitobacteriaceae bacterium]|nr:metalloenzyme [Desulfitobacteriaceae bacterium]MDI6915050.1 metalloenzyme [Desulfitobacteriaceae bacterium]